MSDPKTALEFEGTSALGMLRDISLASSQEAQKTKALKEQKDVEKAAQGFEALLLHQMIKEMWATVGTTGLFGENSNEGQIYRDMLNQAIADSVSEGRGIGVKEFLKRELGRAESTLKQEVKATVAK